MKFGDKDWLKSKTFWTAVIAFAIGGARAIGYETPPYVLEMLMAFGLYSLRDAVGKK
jgi:hypothetical protein